jgi:ferredoxin
MKLVIEDDCVRCGLCADICPELFKLDKAKDVMRIQCEEVPPNLIKKAQEAMEGCAFQALHEKK